MTVGTVTPPNRPSRRGEFSPLALAVDDNHDNLLVLEYTLISLGFRFIGTVEAIAGLTLVKQHHPDLILLDIMLPGIDGLELAAMIRSDPSLLYVPVIAVTGLASDEDRDRILRSGFTDYIRRPFMLDDLEAIIHRHIQVPTWPDGGERLPEG